MAKQKAHQTIPVSPQSSPPQASPMIQPGDGFKDGRPVLGSSGGFTSPSMDVKYTVERTVPPDGLVGSHLGRFSVNELGDLYGEGTYKILKYEPGRPVPIEFIQKIAGNYGPTRHPRMANSVSRGSFLKGMPKKMVERSILNRLTECRDVLEASIGKIKGKEIDPAILKGETDFVLHTMRDVDSLLIHLARHQESEAKEPVGVK